MEEEGRTLAPPAAPAKRDQGPSAAPEAAGHDNDGSDGVRTEEEGRTLVLSAASAKRDQGPSAASEAAGHDNDGITRVTTSVRRRRRRSRGQQIVFEAVRGAATTRREP